MQRGFVRSLAFLYFAVVLLDASSAETGVLRSFAYRPGTPEAARTWQNGLRSKLFDLLHVTDLVETRTELPLHPELGEPEARAGYVLRTVRLSSTPGRTFSACLALPEDAKPPYPAVVCIHGHGGNRMTPFDPERKEYKNFGGVLVRKGFAVISTDVGQHEVYESGRTLMGERLWDLMRCVDFLASIPEVDRTRIGCAGLSLGGEMAMWLGAMDTRIAATASCGFLTVMDQMEQNHCMCWKFDGLRELADFADVYSLIAPRALQCQNGRQEPETQFFVPIAQEAMRDLLRIYTDLGVPDNAVLHLHNGGHEIDRDALTSFLERHLGAPKCP